MPWIFIFYILIGFIFLIKSSDFFVERAALIAEKLGVSKFVIGLTIVAVGTSLPELASATMASFYGSSGIAVGTVLGSNVANIALIIGVSAFLMKLKLNEAMVKQDGYILGAITIVAAWFMLNSFISRFEGFILFSIFFLYILFLLKQQSTPTAEKHFRQFVYYVYKADYISDIAFQTKRILSSMAAGKRPGTQLIKELFLILGSIVVITISANYLIEGSLGVARYFNVSENIIGLTIIALGTSLPELSVSLSAAKQNYGEILLGNIIGTNISNTLLVLGTAAIIKPIVLLPSTILIILPAMMAITLLFLIFIRTSWKITKAEATILLIIYFSFITYLFTTTTVI